MTGPLLNYTTTVAVDQTVTHMSRILARAGARSVATIYQDGAPVGMAFVLTTPYGEQHFRLPVAVDEVRKVLAEQHRRHLLRGASRSVLTAEHAARVAWRIAKDWLEAQLALIAAGMATLDQVMLPYQTVDDGRTVYEVVRAQERAALTAGGDR